MLEHRLSARIVATLLVSFALSAHAQDVEDRPPGDRKATAGSDGDPNLRALLDPVFDDGPKGRYSVYVGRTDGTTLYARNADTALHPASNMKLVTTATALHTLGPAHKWRTDLLATNFKDGVADRLYLVGRGDPFFVTESLLKMVADAQQMGLKRVRKGIVVDDTYFTDRYLAPGFEDRPKDDASYRAATGGMSLNFNSIQVRIKPGSKPGRKPIVTTLPPSNYAIIDNDATTSSGGKERLGLTARAHKGRTKLMISGAIPVKHRGITVRRRIDNPPQFAGRALVGALKTFGIKVNGDVKVGRVPDKAKRLVRHWSPALGKVVDDVNKLSNNFMAEHLMRTLGAVKYDRGGWDEGRKVIDDFLTQTVGINGFVVRNGSGLFGDSVLSARQFGALLSYMHTRRPALPEFAASLAIGGHDGTLRRRMKYLKPGQLRAKTGTLRGVICLSGYVEFADGTTGVFSILYNDVKGRAWTVWKVQEAVVKALVAYSPR
ncbi:MAG: D-alanyl-D-alanine carboxypeptidase/D-alanyl-D-alanine-endopeptidase (penicillin-binding protein 4) [Bradymonadia bacterium]|jgi:D-alanyl-D-alanine carboxypeptidase/D-alanyl-D-alanine-endopeptidase (penicillin-binding protein 4)